jgi:Tol biopolymer transport system component
MNADVSDQTRLTTNAGGDFLPAWSPDGQQIAFISTRDGPFGIYVMGDDGSNPTRLTPPAVNDWLPTWSPDGERIAFGSTRDGNNEIYVMNADGSGQTRITTNAASDWLPAWSPDGGQIAFISDRDGNDEIYVMNADGSGQTRLTTHAADDLDPDWGAARDTGVVRAQVTVPTSAACLELSTSGVDFGTLPLGAEDQAGAPPIVVSNCSGLSETIFARGTDAAASGAAWALTDSPATCADTLGIDAYHLDLSDGVTSVRLSTANKQLQTLASGADLTRTARIFTACPGSSGGGTTMAMQIVFVATE